MTKTVERIIELMKQSNNTAHSLEVKAQIPISSINGWRSDKFQPSMDSIKKLARYFNVSADYLLCLTDEPRSLKSSNPNERAAAPLITEFAILLRDKRFVNIARMYKTLPNKYCEQVYGYIQGILMTLGFNMQNILEK